MSPSVLPSQSPSPIRLTANRDRWPLVPDANPCLTARSPRMLCLRGLCVGNRPAIPRRCAIAAGSKSRKARRLSRLQPGLTLRVGKIWRSAASRSPSTPPRSRSRLGADQCLTPAGQRSRADRRRRPRIRSSRPRASSPKCAFYAGHGDAKVPPRCGRTRPRDRRELGTPGIGIVRNAFSDHVRSKTRYAVLRVCIDCVATSSSLESSSRRS